MNIITEPITPTSIRRAHRDELEFAATTLAAAFQDDPVFSWCVPDVERRQQILPSFFGLVAQTLAVYEEIHVTADGAAMWVPPGLPAVPEASAPAFEEGLAELLGEDADRTFELVLTMEEQHPHADHHYLWFLGVHPRRQGAGIGSALLRHGLGAAERSSLPSYLEATSKDNVRLYERHGFEVVGEIHAADCPPLWAMWRPGGNAS